MSKLRSGEWVEVRSKEEILRTLDNDGCLEGLPFMPQMFQYCGQTFRIYKRAHKTCDTITGKWLGRKLANGVHLDLRCDGKAYGNCQAACLIFWKEAWLRPVIGGLTSAKSSSRSCAPSSGMIGSAMCTEDDVCKATDVRDADGEPIYRCQATRLLDYTAPLPWWDVRQYVEDYTSGNATLGRIFIGLAYVGYYFGSLAYRGRLGRPGRWLYDRFQGMRGGFPFPRRQGNIPFGAPTPACDLNLQPGELVRVKSFEEILASLDTAGKNRGLGFDAELVPYCGRTYRVRARVNSFIDEKTGRMIRLKTPAVQLEGVCCQSRYSHNRMFCPRSIYSWWREIWLERISEAAPADLLASTGTIDHRENEKPSYVAGRSCTRNSPSVLKLD
ncbi:hypothetical protein [Bradyrhizobium sp. 153]|uniref:hypothetical protein n=1 Tax=Bradyrhizobium sp. 153 TaxID=2782627 RepID=UPI001FFA01D1|nr:hypothetical protein [Bradyrhizobium sp. 153]MCK1667877.1 hypothetical protein [Bradyrhizobium sp. 153]